ncbi:aldo/keto reductase [Demequina sp. NBRC 110053]|uniref:aldo/keto reductase n=1 Tax=Demequina sp. NBRC 110053 TaxID=1570342 RepID=UPI0009FD5E5F|nr:aldo/keto reductase [Demequina sp. NBRC 110053]
MTTTITATSATRVSDSDVHVVPIALGAMLMGTRTPEEESRRILDHYLGEVAPRFARPDGTPALAMIDTADCYCWWEAPGEEGGHSESLLGRWMADAGARDRILLATKGTGWVNGVENAWKDGEADWEYARAHFAGASAPVLERSVEASLDRLGTDHVDLYYVHVDDRSTPLEESLETLAGFVADGRIGAYGWSNVRTWRLAQIRALCAANGWPQPVALQQQHSYLHPRAGLRHGSIVSDEQLDYLESHPDLQLVAYSPILKGLFSEAGKRGDDFWAMGNYAGPDADARLAAVDDVARETGATGNQVVLAWMLAQDAPRVLPLIGPRTYDQYRENIAALDVELTTDQVERLDAAGA